MRDFELEAVADSRSCGCSAYGVEFTVFGPDSPIPLNSINVITLNPNIQIPIT